VEQETWVIRLGPHARGLLNWARNAWEQTVPNLKTGNSVVLLRWIAANVVGHVALKHISQRPVSLRPIRET